MAKRFPVCKQLDAKDCGPSCLKMIAKFYGRYYRLETLRKQCYIDRNGVSLQGISEAAQWLGFTPRGVKCSWEGLKSNIKLPCIVHWSKNHFVVVYAIEAQRNKNKEEIVRVVDPAFGRIAYRRSEFLNQWLISEENTQGVALSVEPTDTFYQKPSEGKGRFNLAHLFQYLKAYQKAFYLLVALMLLGSLISLVFPFLTQLIVDVGIKGQSIHIVMLLFLAQLMLILGQTANGVISSFLAIHITGRIGISFISAFLDKLMRLPIAFFDVRMVGDIMQRISDNRRIQVFLTESLVSIIIATITFVAYSASVAKYSMSILYIFLLGSILYVFWILLFLKKRKELDYKQFQASAVSQSNIVQLISGMQEIKLHTCEKKKRWEWEQIQVNLFQIAIKSLSLSQIQQIGGVFINQLKNTTVSFLVAKAVIDGQMTLGMMMAIQYILGQLNAPLNELIRFIQEAQDASISLDRLGEIYHQPEEEPEDSPKIATIPPSKNIVFENVGFRYGGPDSASVLKNLNLTIEAGKVTAIVGESGSGKTTLIKLLLGFYPPTEGRIALGNTDLTQYSERSWRKQCGVIMQESYIFSDSLLNNIAISDQSCDRDELMYAVKMSNLQDFVSQLPLGLETKIGSEGNGLSAGQRQRVLIARAIYKNPAYIFLDEATNALDATNERIITENLARFYRGKTVVVVAHRLSTVKNADMILVLDRGKVSEQGTHQELIQKQGNYYHLIKDQLELDAHEN